MPGFLSLAITRSFKFLANIFVSGGNWFATRWVTLYYYYIAAWQFLLIIDKAS